MTEITYGDRIAAETYRAKLLDAIWEGKPEEPVLLEAFARHRMEERAAIVAEICEWLRDSNNTMTVMEKWHDRKQDGTLTDKTRENIGVAYIALKDAADEINQHFGDHLK